MVTVVELGTVRMLCFRLSFAVCACCTPQKGHESRADYMKRKWRLWKYLVYIISYFHKHEHSDFFVLFALSPLEISSENSQRGCSYSCYTSVLIPCRLLKKNYRESEGLRLVVLRVRLVEERRNLCINPWGQKGL